MHNKRKGKLNIWVQRQGGGIRVVEGGSQNFYFFQKQDSKSLPEREEVEIDLKETSCASLNVTRHPIFLLLLKKVYYFRLHFLIFS